MLETVLLTLILIILTGGTIFLYRFLKGSSEKKQDDQSLVLLQNQIAELNRTLDTKLSEAGRAAQFQFGESAKIIKDVTERLTKLDEANKQVLGFTEQLKNLQDILKNPKQRGVLGEYYLETILKNIFSPQDYQMQYPFKDGTIVDAVIFVANQIVPVDSKFSLENYNRLINENDPVEREKIEKIFVSDLKNRIDETSKYIKPSEGTVGVAFMFIPSEAIYYDLLINQVGTVKSNTRSLIDYAYNEKHVVVVSPTTLAAYFQVLSQALRAFKIQESTEDIKKEIEKLTTHLRKYDEYVLKLGKNLSATVGAYNVAYKEFSKIDKDILKITGEAIGTEALSLERPQDSEENELP